MELSRTASPTKDTSALLPNDLPTKSVSGKHIKQCSILQLCLLFIFGSIFGVIISNMDRFITWIDDSSNSGSTSPPQVPEFGHGMYEYFELKEEWRSMYFNWGSWGGIPKPVMNAAQELYDTIANCPNCYFSFDRSNLIEETLQLMAQYLGISSLVTFKPVVDAF